MKRHLRKIAVLRHVRDVQKGFKLFYETPQKALVRYLKESNITNVLDIGANVGQFGIDLRRNGYTGQIYSFEPVSEFFSSLQKTAKSDGKWQAFQIGLGAQEGLIDINISGNDGLSSSILPMADLHITSFPSSGYIATEKIRLSTLDNELASLGLNPTSIFLKIDVQGYEAQVLLGANKSIGRIPFCYLESSLNALYDGELQFLELLNKLAESNHFMIEIFRGEKGTTGELLQVDVLTRLKN